MAEALLDGVRTPREGRFLLPLALPLAVLGALALAASWLAPNHYPPWTSFHGEAAAFAALCCFCLARLARPEGLIPGRAALVILAAVPLVWIQWLAGQIPYLGDALVSSLYLAGFAMAWWLGHNSPEIRDTDTVNWLATVVTVAAVLSVLVATMQWLRLENAIGIYAAERGPEMRAYSNVGQPNHLSTLVLTGTVLAAGLFLRGVIKGWQLVALVAWLSWGLTLTESRSGLLAAVAVGAFVLLKRRELGLAGNWRWIAGWWLLLLLLGVLWQPLNDLLYLQPPREVALTSSNGRNVMWQQSVAAIRESPWVGYGWRQTMQAQKVGAQLVPGWLATDYAHSLVLDLLLWVGVPLGIVILALLGWWLTRVAVRVRGSAQLVLFTATVPFLVHSFFEFPFAYSYFLFPAAWMLGAVSRQQSGPDRAPAGRRLRLASFAAVVLFGAVSLATAAEYLEAEEDHRVMRFELRRVGRRPPGHAEPELHLLTQIDELLKLGRMVPRAGMPPEDIERLRVGSAVFGWATLHLSYAVALGLNGHPEEASRQLGLLRSVYGPEVYAQVRRIFLQLPQQHAQLAAVKIP